MRRSICLGAHANGIKIDGRFRCLSAVKMPAPISTNPGRRIASTTSSTRARNGRRTPNSISIHHANSQHDSWRQMTRARDRTEQAPRAYVARALSATTTCWEQPAAREPGRSRAGRPLMARRKGRALSSTAQGTLGRSQKGEVDTLRRRDLRGSERGGLKQAAHLAARTANNRLLNSRSSSSSKNLIGPREGIAAMIATPVTDTEWTLTCGQLASNADNHASAATTANHTSGQAAASRPIMPMTPRKKRRSADDNLLL